MFSYAHVKKMLMLKSGNKPSGISTCSYMYIALELYMLYVYPTFKRNKKKNSTRSKQIENGWIYRARNPQKYKYQSLSKKIESVF